MFDHVVPKVLFGFVATCYMYLVVQVHVIIIFSYSFQSVNEFFSYNEVLVKNVNVWYFGF